MRVCIDTNVLLELFGVAQPYGKIVDALQQGRLEFAVSNEILLEYEEVVTELSGHGRWTTVERWLDAISRLHNNVLYVQPQYRFRIITLDPDDNKFVDCAIAVQADFILTHDRHFDPLLSSGYKPRPVDPVSFITRHL